MPSLIEIKVIVIHKAVVKGIGINRESDEDKEKNEDVIRSRNYSEVDFGSWKRKTSCHVNENRFSRF